jgi:Zn-dependent protease with chaperone function
LLARTDTSQERPDHRHVFGLALTLGAGGLLAAVAAVATAIDSVHHAVGGYRHVAIAGVHFTYPTLNAAEVLLLVLATLGAAVVAIAVKASWRQRQAYRCFIGRMGIVGSLDKHPSVRVIEDPRPQAFCAGYLRPAVYISRRTLDLLADDELKAVLAHERYHLRVRDPLRFACGRVLGEALFFVPVLRSLSQRYSRSRPAALRTPPASHPSASTRC